MEDEDEAAKEHLAAREVARGHEADVKAAQAGRQKLVKVCVCCVYASNCTAAAQHQGMLVARVFLLCVR